MMYLSTLDPPASISYFNPSYAPVYTNTWLSYSLTDARIRSAFENAQRELDRYERYPARWDGYRAEPFDKELLGEISNILTFTEEAFVCAGIAPSLLTTGPASDGSVDIEIQVHDKRVIMTLYPREQQVKLYSSHAKETNEHIVALGTPALANWLSWLYRSGNVPSKMDKDQSNT